MTQIVLICLECTLWSRENTQELECKFHTVRRYYIIAVHLNLFFWRYDVFYSSESLISLMREKIWYRMWYLNSRIVCIVLCGVNIKNTGRIYIGTL